MDTEGKIFNIQPFSVSDGPGIRTTVFFKGCNLHCDWCHNPESVSPKAQLLYYPDKCIACGACEEACPCQVHTMNAAQAHILRREQCRNCGVCVNACHSGALMLAGRQVGTAEVFSLVCEDRHYFEQSGGGVTFSGGECMIQTGFLLSLLKRCRAAGIHTAVDTAGMVPFSKFERVIPYTDLFLYDIKAADPVIHQKLTGADNGLILDNLRALCTLGLPVFVRVPFIPNANNREMRGIARLLAPLSVRQVDILPYHSLGEGKHTALGKSHDDRFGVPLPEQLYEAKKIFEAYGLNVSVVFNHKQQ